MIRVIQRRLIIPRGDTGIFTIPAMTQAEGAIGVFTIFDPITNTRIFQKQVEIEGENFNISFSHADTVNLKAGDYLWDIKFYKNPILADNKVIDGEEINSYYAAFQAPKCEIRETGDDFLMIEGQPAKIEDLNIILGATEAANAAKAAATEQAGIAATKAEEAAAKLEQMMAAIPTKVSELENDSGYLQEETDPTVPAWAKAAEKPTYTPQEVGALPADTFIPSKVSDLTDDSGHYTKPANGIPASDLEETYLTEHQDLSNYVQKTDYATTNNAGIVKIGAGLSIDGSFLTLYKASNNQIKQGTASYSPIVPAIQERSTFYGLAKAAGDTTQSQSANAVGTYTDEAKAAIQQMLDVPSTSAIPTNVSDLTNDASYLTEHQDISGKANVADLAAVATSGSYNDLEDKPTIPDVRIDGTSIVENGVANIPIAQNNTLGVIKTIPTILNCATVDSLGNLYVNAANGAQIKAASSKNNPIVPGSMHMATFYGLSKAAGADLANEENITVGTYPASAKTAIQTMLDVPSNAAMTTAIGNAIGNINSFDMAVVQELPAQDISTHTIYLVPKTGETNDVYDEYVYINNAWEMVGNTQIDLSNYVQKTDYATMFEPGVIQAVQMSEGSSSTYNGVALNTSHLLRIYPATEDGIKNPFNKDYAPIVPKTQHTAAFYGLAKAAGDTTQSQSENAVGTYTNEAKAAICSMIGAAASADVTVYDVQINGTSIIENGVANVPISNASTYGVVKSGIYGIDNDNGELRIKRPTDAEIKSGDGTWRVLNPAQQHQSAFYGLAKAAGDTTQSQSNNVVGQYTDEAKAAIQTMLGVPSTSDMPDVSIYATKADTVLDTTLSLGRLANSDVGENSVALGYDVTASGDYSFATGSETIASSDSAYAEGENTQATDSAAHAEGTYTQANGYASHAEGDNSIANGWFSHAEGSETTASGRSTHVFGERNYNNNKYPSEDNEQRGTMVEIVGNGQGNGYSNARALTWTGDEYLAGNLYVNANATSTSGTRVATVTEIPEVPVQDVQVGGTSIVDANGNANIPVADANTLGIVGVATNDATISGIKRDGAGKLTLVPASSSDIKTATANVNRPVIPNTQHESTFYGLAKAAGDTTQSQSDNAVGTYTDEAKAAIQQMLDIPSTSDIPDTSIYATKADTVLETSLSRGRKTGSKIGEGSFAFGNGNVCAIGNYSHAEGMSSAIGSFAHSECNSYAVGTGSHSEGVSSFALGRCSHAEGTSHLIYIFALTGAEGSTVYTYRNTSTQYPNYDLDLGFVAHINDMFATIVNVDKNNQTITLSNSLGALNDELVHFNSTYAKGAYSHTEGQHTVAECDLQHVQGKSNAIDTLNKYADIVGNGSDYFTRSNAYALTWTGDGHYAGDVYVHSNTDSSGGERLAKESELGLKVVRLI